MVARVLNIWRDTMNENHKYMVSMVYSTWCDHASLMENIILTLTSKNHSAYAINKFIN